MSTPPWPTSAAISSAFPPTSWRRPRSTRPRSSPTWPAAAARWTRVAPLTPAMTLAGPAFTIEVRPGDNLMIHAAMAMAKPGDVLVIDGKGDTSCALMGALMINACKVLGLGGVVIDGAVRDTDELRELGFPVFAVGVEPERADQVHPRPDQLAHLRRRPRRQSRRPGRRRCRRRRRGRAREGRLAAAARREEGRGRDEAHGRHRRSGRSSPAGSTPPCVRPACSRRARRCEREARHPRHGGRPRAAGARAAGGLRVSTPARRPTRTRSPRSARSTSRWRSSCATGRSRPA